MGTTQETNEIAEIISEEAEQVTTLFTKIADYVKGMLPSLISAGLLLIVGLIVSRILLKIIFHALRTSRLEPTASSFLHSLLSVILHVLVGVIVLSVLNVPMTSIITVIGTMGLAIGLALQNSLSNVAGGFLILFSKPLKVGDFVEFSGVTGTVESIAILQTKLRQPDGTTVFIPNGKIADSMILNYSEDPKRRIDLKFGISYDSDFEEAKAAIMEVLKRNKLAENNPPPVVRVGEMADSAVLIYVRVWTMHEHYWDLYFDLHEQVKKEFDQRGIGIPFPQVDVHMDSGEPPLAR